MAAQRLTATKIEKHKLTRDDETLADGNGLYLRFRRGTSGTISKTWMYTYKVGTKSVYLRFGEHQASLSDFDLILYRLPAGARLTLEIARRMATEATDWRKRGLDPKEHIQAELDRIATQAVMEIAEAERAKSLAQAELLNVSDLFEAWLKDGVRRKDGNAELRRTFNLDILPAIGQIPVRNVTEHDVRTILRSMVERGVNRTAVMAKNNLTQMFAWAGKRQPWRKLLVEGDPMCLIEIEKIVSPEYDLQNQRNRVLQTDEIRELYSIFHESRACYEASPNKRVAVQPIERHSELAVGIMLSTMCRVGELSMARWEHVDWALGEWFIPRQNVKGNLADHRVYLSEFSLELFRQLHKISGHTEWCFPSRDKVTHLNTKAISKQIADRQAIYRRKANDQSSPLKNRRSDNSLVLAGGKNGAWTPHDLRRTGATIMQKLGIPLEIIDRCQNHVLPGSKVRRHYLHHDYADEKRDAWRQLGQYLAALTSRPPIQLGPSAILPNRIWANA
ncbi:tyrosine-type recombinase/integrase [Massilia horti]|uniref:Site-specific integrase n=1 Tax=Massilia horti TaxID=2562153 RepID=A0A4Y9T593_9BURK|nr:site-specific integrase [Massilia horti]TFW33593.1 site-specific integrase [Massilia horti]